MSSRVREWEEGRMLPAPPRPEWVTCGRVSVGMQFLQQTRNVHGRWRGDVARARGRVLRRGGNRRRGQGALRDCPRRLCLWTPGG